MPTPSQPSALPPANTCQSPGWARNTDPGRNSICKQSSTAVGLPWPFGTDLVRWDPGTTRTVHSVSAQKASINQGHSGCGSLIPNVLAEWCGWAAITVPLAKANGGVITEITSTTLQRSPRKWRDNCNTSGCEASAQLRESWLSSPYATVSV